MKIGIIGEENQEFSLYLSSIIKNVNKTVAIYDTEKKVSNYKAYIDYDERFGNKYTFNEVDFYFKDALFEKNYNVVLDTYDFNEDNFNILIEKLKESMAEYEVLIILCKQNKLQIDMYAKIAEEIYEMSNSIIIVEQDLINSKIKPSKSITEFKLDILNKIVSINSIYLEEKNIKNKLNLQYGNKVFLKISQEYKETLKFIIEHIFDENDVSEKEIKKAIKKSKKGI